MTMANQSGRQECTIYANALKVDDWSLSRRPEDFQTKELLPMEGKTVGSLLVITISQLHVLGKGECTFYLGYFLTTDLRFARSEIFWSLVGNWKLFLGRPYSGIV